MAESKKVTIRLPLDKKPGASQQEFYSLNFKNYIIKRGVDVEVPKEIADMINENIKAEDEAFAYSETNKLPDTLK